MYRYLARAPSFADPCSTTLFRCPCEYYWYYLLHCWISKTKHLRSNIHVCDLRTDTFLDCLFISPSLVSKESDQSEATEVNDKKNKRARQREQINKERKRVGCFFCPPHLPQLNRMQRGSCHDV